MKKFIAFKDVDDDTILVRASTIVSVAEEYDTVVIITTDKRYETTESISSIVEQLENLGE